MSRLQFDHWLLVKRHGVEVSRFAAAMQRAVKEGWLLDIDVEHDHDNRCCLREPWSTTLRIVMSRLEEA